MNKITLQYYGMPGTGRTATEAKRDAGDRIAAALEGDYAPVFAMWRGTAGIASRDPKHGWGYRFINREFPSTSPLVQQVSHCSSGFADQRDCIEAMLRHIADLEMRADDTSRAALDLFDTHLVRRAEMATWFENKLDALREIQERLRIARSRGFTSEDARAFAYRDPSRIELWA